MVLRIGIILVVTICLSACRPKSVQEESSPVINFKPDHARTLKMSELFDGYEVLTFKGVVCNRIGDFVKMGDRLVATSIVTEGMVDIVTLCVFDSSGEFLHTLGAFGRGPGEYLYLNDQVILSPDSNVVAMDVLGLKCYALDGKLLWHKKFEQPSYINLGYPAWMLNDSCVVYSIFPCCGDKYQPDQCLVNLLAWKNERLEASYFFRQKIGEYAVSNHLYVMDDTLCYYSDIDNGIYHVSEDTITLRYRIDKGAFKDYRLCRDIGNANDYLKMIDVAENNHYVFMVVQANRKYYLSVYDKLKNRTLHYDSVEDDLLMLGHYAHKSTSILQLYNNWKPGMRQSDDYMYFYFPFSDYCTMLDRLKASLNKEQWEEYRRAHPDLMKIYQEQGEEGNTVVLGYRFK